MKRVPSAPSMMVTVALLVGLLVVGSAGDPGPSADAAMVAPTWGTAIDIPGIAALGGPDNGLTQVACTSPGNCTSGGSYTVESKIRPLLVDQVNGVWGNAYEVPGKWDFDPDDVARAVDTIACSPDGGCIAAGQYSTGLGLRVFVTRRVGGVWTAAEPMPNGSNVGEGGAYFLTGSSCSSSGNCAVVGFYITPTGRTGGYIVDLTGGTWQDAIDVPGLVALSTGQESAVWSVSCPADGACSATGFYRTSTETHGFVVDQSSGVWGTATDVPGLVALAANGASSSTISCSSAGNCSVAGYYRTAGGVSPNFDTHPFVADRIAGHWNDAQPLILTGIDDSRLDVISCPTDGNCSAVGRFREPGDLVLGDSTLFVTQRSGGSWTAPVPMSGLAVLNTANEAGVSSLSCAAPGVCAATGHYTDATGKVPMVVNSIAGVWSAPIPVPGLAVGSPGDCGINIFGNTCPSGLSVSCASTTRCAVVGETFTGGVRRGFLVDYVVRPEPDPVPPAFTG